MDCTDWADYHFVGHKIRDPREKKTNIKLKLAQDVEIFTFS